MADRVDRPSVMGHVFIGRRANRAVDRCGPKLCRRTPLRHLPEPAVRGELSLDIAFPPSPCQAVGVLHRVVALALPGLITFDLSCLVQIFGCVPDLDGDEPRRYDFVVCGPGGRKVRTSDGFDLAVTHDLTALGDADTVAVPGYDKAWSLAPPAQVVEALRDATARGARVLSICVGAFALAHSGLLDDRRATTHWAAIDRLAVQFPAVSVVPDVLYVDEGDVLTSAGLASGLDLALHVVRADHGAQAAADLARWNVVA